MNDNDKEDYLDHESFNDFTDPNNLLQGFYKASQGVTWKSSVQFFKYNLGINIFILSYKLRNGLYEQKPVHIFILKERGKLRKIKAVAIDDRVVQRTLCDEVLVPALSKYLIYDNGASIKGKGLSFSRTRLKHHLEDYYNTYKMDGYILLIDFSKYFDNILHEVLINLVNAKICDRDIMEIYSYIVSTFSVDVSYMNDEEYDSCLSKIYDSLSDNFSTSNPPPNHDIKYMDKSLGIGSQVSQISGVFYTTEIDNFCKIVKRFKYYGRYMDDSYCISNSKEELDQLLIDIKIIAQRLGIFINDKKTRIVKLSDGFKWLQIKYILNENGKINWYVGKKAFIRERRRLHRQYKKFIKGEMKFSKIYNLYKAWHNQYAIYDSDDFLCSLDESFYSLFGQYIDDYLKQKDDYKHKKYSSTEITNMMYRIRI